MLEDLLTEMKSCCVFTLQQVCLWSKISDDRRNHMSSDGGGGGGSSVCTLSVQINTTKPVFNQSKQTFSSTF